MLVTFGTLVASSTAMICGGSASAGVVTFDELGARPSSFIDVNPLRNEYAGLRFSGPSALDGGAILDQAGNFGINARSGRNFLAFNRLAVATMKNGGQPIDPETIEFLSAPVLSVEIYCYSKSAATFKMDGFDNMGALVTTSSTSFGADWVKLSITSKTPIAKITLTETKGRDNNWIFDDLSFTPVPAPMSAGVLVLGLAAVSRRRR